MADEIVEPEVIEEETTEVPEVNLDDISEEEADELLKKEEDSLTEEDPKPETKPDDDKATQEKPEDETTGDPEKSEPEELNRDGEPKKDRIKEMQVEVTKRQMEAADLRRDLEKHKAELRKMKLESFKVLTEAEEEELYSTDKESYDEYMQNKVIHEAEVKEQETLELQLIETSQKSEISSFLTDLSGYDIDITRDITKEPEEVQKFAKEMAESGIQDKIMEYLETNVRPGQYGYSKQQLMDVYKVLNHDNIVADATKGKREQAVEDIEKVTDSGSKLNKATPTKDRDKGLKTADDFTQEEIEEMSEEQLDQLL